MNWGDVFRIRKNSSCSTLCWDHTWLCNQDICETRTVGLYIYIHISVEGCSVYNMFLAIYGRWTPKALLTTDLGQYHSNIFEQFRLCIWIHDLNKCHHPRTMTNFSHALWICAFPKSIYYVGGFNLPNANRPLEIVAQEHQIAKETVTKHSKRPWTVSRIYKRGCRLICVSALFNDWLNGCKPECTIKA